MSIRGCMKALASVVLAGGTLPAVRRNASAVASRSMRCSRICWIRWVKKTDSAMERVGAKLVNFPFDRERAA